VLTKPQRTDRKNSLYRRTGLVLLTLVFATLSGGAERNAERTPVLLELFTSEACSSCPPADRLLARLDANQPAAGAELIALSEHVDYFNYPGWKDRFSSPQYTARQQAYTDRYGFDGVYTPELVVDGRFGFVGSDEKAATAAIRKVLHEYKLPISIGEPMLRGKKLSVRVAIAGGESREKTRANLYIALADDRQETRVSGGENSGRVLQHVAVSRSILDAGAVNAGDAFSRELTIDVPDGPARERRIIAFVQDVRSGHVLAVARRRF
jgi:hypothetical protein